MTKIYSVCCRGSLNTKTTKCFTGGGWTVTSIPANCPHCGKEMFVTAEMTVIDMRP